MSALHPQLVSLPFQIAMNPREVYERNPAGTDREAACKLRPHEWDLYLRLDGLRTLQEISATCKLDLPWIVSDIERLQQLDLVRVVELDLGEYQQRFIKGREIAPAALATPAPVPAEKPANPAEGKRVSFSLRRGERPLVPLPWRQCRPLPPGQRRSQSRQKNTASSRFWILSSRTRAAVRLDNLLPTGCF